MLLWLYNSGWWNARIVAQDVLFLIMWMTNICSRTGTALFVLGWCKGPQQRGYQEFQNCNDGKTNNRLIRAHLAALVVQCDQDTAPISETAPPAASNLEFGTALPAASNLDFGTDVLQDPTSGPPQKKRKNDPLPNSFAEGTMRTRMRDLLEMVGYMAYIPGWYAAHTARGKWQEREIKNTKTALYTNEEKVALFTIDMKSKTAIGKNEDHPTGSWNGCTRYVPSRGNVTFRER